MVIAVLSSCLASGTVLAQQELVSFGTGSFTVDPAATSARYSQTAAALTFSPGVALGDTLGGGFSARNWTDAGFQSFGVVMSVAGANPDVPFHVEFYDARTETIVATLAGSTEGVGASPVFVPLEFVTGGRAQLASVSGLQFTWDGSGNMQATISSLAIRGTVPPPVPVKKKQTITFPQPAGQVFGPGKTFRLSANADSKLPVRFVSNDTNLLTISNNVATVRRAGKVTITATNTGNSDYFPAGLARTLTIARAPQTIPAFRSTNNVPFGRKVTFANKRSTARLPVNFRVLSGPARITNNVLTLTGVGRVVVEASQTGNINYRPARALTNSFTAIKASQSINFRLPRSKSFRRNGTIPLAAASSARLPVSYVSSRPGVLAISGSKAVIKGRGTVTITATQRGNARYRAANPVSRTIEIK